MSWAAFSESFMFYIAYLSFIIYYMNVKAYETFRMQY